MMFVRALLVAVMTAGAAYAQQPAASFEQALASLPLTAPESDEEMSAMEDIIALARVRRPELPQDAVMLAAEADAAAAKAMTAAEYLGAANAWGRAARIAPWIADYHFARGAALTKAGANASAARAFSLYLLAAPKAKDREHVQALIAGLRRHASAAVAAPVSREPARKAGDIFRDCPDCPEMVVIPAGRFIMGSPASEKGRFDSEGPQRTVTVKAFAMGRHNVTIQEFSLFLSETGYQPPPCDRRMGKSWRVLKNGIVHPPGQADLPRQPAACLNWHDAEAYIEWLNRRAGANTYRLPTEAEWEYAARAGTATARWWGDDIGNANANCNGCGSHWDNRLIAPVGSFGPSAFGLYDMLGNVWQWTADCWNESYVGAPADSAAWHTGDCTKRVMRGGSWSNIPAFIRSAARSRGDRGGDDFDYAGYVGFRVVKALP